MNYKVAIKVNGKWMTVGSVKKNKWGNLSLGLMKKSEVRAALDGDGWANFALFEDKGKDAPKEQEKPGDDAPDLDGDSIPF